MTEHHQLVGLHQPTEHLRVHSSVSMTDTQNTLKAKREKTMEKLEVDMIDFSMKNQKYKPEYHGKIVNDGSQSWYFSKDGFTNCWLIDDLPERLLENVETEPEDFVQTESTSNSLIGSIGATPKTIKITF